MKKYNPTEIEAKWQRVWRVKKLHETNDTVEDKKNFMLLTEFPYPSGNLHIGHWYAFALPDIKARYLRMKGHNVLYPVGFDAFGLPAENAAIQHGISPADWTKQNIATMTKQLASMGASFDWSRMVSTIDPDYYRWTQWIFLQFYKKGLAYRATTTVNWCPKDKTVLANEQVVNGCCDRCGTPVVQKEREQWMFKITAYADQLVDELENLDWPETTKLAQKNWIGRSEGAMISFQLSANSYKLKAVDVFTTRPDTLFGATFLVISPELAKKWMDVGWQATDAVKRYVAEALSKRQLQRLEQAGEKTGVPTDIVALNPVNQEKIPVWVADYVLGEYGTGAVMAVPAHDERDFAFAKKFKLPIRKVITDKTETNHGEPSAAFIDEGWLVDSGEFTGLSTAQARAKITEHLEHQNLGRAERTYRLHDWVLSRQRYWGVPIPMVRCSPPAGGCGHQPVPEDDLPVKLPKLDDFKPTDDGRSPLAKATKWVNVKCPKCGKAAERETDTMDTFVDSSWYFLRYTDPANKDVLAASDRMGRWLPVPQYIGGAEHNTMHLLYSRFFTKALHELGYLSFSEPFASRVNRGIILGQDSQKMSKSRGNVVDPDTEVAKYGADTVRMYLAFMAPYEQGGPWDPKGINGVWRFLHRVWNLVSRSGDTKFAPTDSARLAPILHKTIKAVGDDIQKLHLNTGVSGLMKMLNELEDTLGEKHSLSRDDAGLVLKLVAPFAPHLAEELWHEALGNPDSIHIEAWPEYDASLLADAMVRMPVQVNGKLRDVIDVKPGTGKEEAVALARSSEKVAKYLSGASPKVIFVPDKLINFVVGE